MQLKYKTGDGYKAYCPIPVHGVYLSLDSSNPNVAWPGTAWRKVTGGVLACAGTTGYAAAGSVGGSKKISVSQMPSHTHEYFGYNSGAGSTTLKGSYPPWVAADYRYNWDMDACRATGGGADYYPLHVSVNVWERTS